MVIDCNSIRNESAIGIVGDVSSRTDNQRAVEETVQRFGRLDAVILNAGVSAGAPFEQVTEEGLDAFEALNRINYFGPVYMTKYALPELIKNKGKLVVISSVFGLHGGPTRTFYAASKFALHGFFDSLRYEVAPKGVTVTMVCPGPVATDIARNRVGPDGKAATMGHFDMKKAISATDAAFYVVDALRRSQRIRTFSLGAYLLYHVQHFCPSFWDYIFLRAMRNLNMLEETGPQH